MKRVVVWFFIVALGIASGAAAQQTGEIFGKVADPSGGVIPGVTVTLTGQRLLQPMTAVSSETGTYRFPRLAIGTYTVKFELSGFKTVVHEEVRVEIGFNVQINATMEISSLQETVTVTGETPVVDLRDTSKGQRFTQEVLQSIPSARDPWVILEQTAGVSMDRQNVGGSQSGQQSNFMARGAYWNQSKWNMDGVDITDQSALGASPVYYDFDMLEEMQITTGGSDASAQTAGVSVNIVTKSGTDKLRGSGRMYFTPEALESVNIDDTLRKQGARSGNPIQDIKDLGMEIGGPIVRGKAWFWGSFGKQDIKVGVEGFYEPTPQCQQMKAALKDDKLAYDVRDIWGCLSTDLTTLNNYNAKVGWQVTQKNRASFLANFAEKVRNARDASDVRPIETTYRQIAVSEAYGKKWWNTGIPSTYKATDQHVFSDRFMAEVAYAHIGNNFALDFHEADLIDVQPSRDIGTGLYGRSYNNNVYVRPFDSIDVTTNYFLPGVLGGDHSFKAGYRYRQGYARSQGQWGGLTVARFTGMPAGGTPEQGVASDAILYRPYQSNYALYTQGFYLQDTYNVKKLTLNLGLRWDWQDDSAQAASVIGHPFQGQTTKNGAVFNYLPGIEFAGADAGVTFSNWAPRIAATYDLMGNGKTVLKGNYARYWAQIGTGTFSGVLNPVTEANIRFPWTDLNGDKFVQANEVDTSNAPLSFGGNYDWRNPSALKVSNRVDPNMVNQATDEVTLSIDREIMSQFAVGASYIWRKYQAYNWNYYDGRTSANYVQKTYTPTAAECPVAGARCETITYFEPTIPQPTSYTLTNEPGYYRDFNGFEVTARKRMANRWMMSASYAYNNAKQYYPTTDSYVDPTNIEQQDGYEYAPETSASGIDNVFVGAKWVAKVSGAYQMPWDVNLAAFYNARQGYPFPQVVQTPDRANQAGRTTVYLDSFGDVRLPTFQTIDMRVDKNFTFGRMKVAGSLDIFNLMNSNTILAQRRTQNATNANQVSQILAPRVLRIGVRVTF